MAEPESDAPTREELNRVLERLERVERQLGLAELVDPPTLSRRPAARRPSEYPHGDQLARPTERDGIVSRCGICGAARTHEDGCPFSDA